MKQKDVTDLLLGYIFRKQLEEILVSLKEKPDVGTLLLVSLCYPNPHGTFHFCCIHYVCIMAHNFFSKAVFPGCCTAPHWSENLCRSSLCKCLYMYVVFESVFRMSCGLLRS